VGGVKGREKGPGTYGSPITNVSPAFTEGTTPRDPTSAAAASLCRASVGPGQRAVWVVDRVVTATYERMSP